jgi:hypothetical protein
VIIRRSGGLQGAARENPSRGGGADSTVRAGGAMVTL